MIGVGVEIAGHAVKVATVDGRPGAFKLVGFEVHRIAPQKGESDDDVVSVLTAALGKAKGPVVCSIRAQDCTIREITVPFVEDEKIRKTIKYQAENYFTSQSIDDLIIDYAKFAELDGKSKLMVAGCRKATIERRLALLAEAGVDPVAIDLDVAAAFNAYAALGAFEGKGAVLLVDIEADTLRVGIVDQGKLRLARAIRMQVNSMRLQQGGGPRKRTGDDSGVYDTAADESARLPVVILDEGEDEAFSLEDSGISETEREGILHRVFMEIDRTVASVNLPGDVELIYLSGASCALDGIEPMFAEHFELETVRLDLAAKLGQAPDKKEKGGRSVSLEGPTAVGLALKALGVDHVGMDFRQEELSYQGTFEQLKRGLACTLTLLCALVFLYAFSLKQDLRLKKERLRAARELEKNLYTVLLPNLDDPNVPHRPLRQGTADDPKYFESLDAEARALRVKYGGGGGGDANAPRFSALEVLRQFSLGKSAVPAAWGIEVMKARVDPRDAGKSTFDCVAVDQGAASELARRFEDNEVVTAKVQSSQFDQKTNRWMFTLMLELRPPGPPGPGRG